MRARECVLTFVEPGLQRRVFAGKIVWLHVRHGGGIYAYMNDVRLDRDLMRDLDAWGVAPCVLEVMGRMAIDVIHYCCRDEDVTYVSSPGQVRRYGELLRCSGRGAHWHLPRRYWQRVKGIQRYRWINTQMELEWLEPEVVRG
ncbi:MAG TPA: hypothetical protein VMW79_10760 [Anaerolineae bacterium]|nr:hypothetical protein [Anaerolineae bacterium]